MFLKDPIPLRPDHVDLIYRKATDSWWVFRHGLDPAGTPLPYGRVVYYAGSEQEARQWVGAHRPAEASAP